MSKRYVALLILGLSMLSSPFAQAEEDESLSPKLAYFTLEPDLTTNFYTKGNRIGYVQVKIDIMVADRADVHLIERHQPLIRNAVIDLLGQQSEDTVKSITGREDLRKALVTHLNDILLPETGRMIIADLLFTKYLYQ